MAARQYGPSPASRLPARSLGHLSAPRLQLVRLFQTLNFGRIEGLVIRDSEPVLDPAPRTIREVKFGGDNAARDERDLQQYLLKSQVIELFEEFDRLQNGTIAAIEAKHGLPFRMILQEPVR